VVNEQGGTAYGLLRAKLTGADEFVLLGRRAAAEAPPLESLYHVVFLIVGTDHQGTQLQRIEGSLSAGNKPEYLGQTPRRVSDTWTVHRLSDLKKQVSGPRCRW